PARRPEDPDLARFPFTVIMNLRDYRLLSQRGAGPDGVSYQACDPTTDTPVEVRVLGGARAAEHRWRGLAKKLRVAAMFEHPAATPTRELNREHAPRYVAGKWGGGKGRGAAVQADLPLSRSLVLAMGRDLAAVLAAGHRLGLVQGRLVPEEIRRTDSGHLK